MVADRPCLTVLGDGAMPLLYDGQGIAMQAAVSLENDVTTAARATAAL